LYSQQAVAPTPKPAVPAKNRRRSSPVS
jgi:hypothetical protein